MFFEHLQGWGLNHLPGQPVPMPDHSFSEEIFPNIQLKPCVSNIQSKPPPKPPLLVSHTWGEPGAPSTQDISKLVITRFQVQEPAFKRPSSCSLQCWLLVM